MAYLVERDNAIGTTELREAEFTLFLSVKNCSSDLQEIYQQNATKHNNNIIHDDFVDSGFDIFIPKEQMLTPENANKVDLNIKCEMVHHVNHRSIPSAFYMYPRSSISKTKFRLANNTGIIDSGYRGNLGAMFDVINSEEEVKCEKHVRLLQICTPTLVPFKVVIVPLDSELSSSRRGNGGFGSTGTGV